MTIRFAVVHDEPHGCAYLPGRTARLPLKLPLRALDAADIDLLLERGERRAGATWYRTSCPACESCEALRVPIAELRPTKSQRRVFRRNEREVEVRLGPAAATERHVEIYNRHRSERGLSAGDEEIELETYRRYYVDSGVDTREVSYVAGGRLVAFSVVDVGRTGISSVYHAFDPDEARRSLGVFSVLAEVDLFGRLGFEWYYLGLHVADCPSLAYKAHYFPHEKLRSGRWLRCEGPDDGGSA